MNHAATSRVRIRMAAFIAFGVAALAGPIGHAGADPAERILDAVTGTYSDGERTLRLAAMPCGGHELCLYVEMVERGREEFPIRQQVWALDNLSDAGAYAMLLGFPPDDREVYATDLGHLALGLWAAPMFFPAIDLDRLVPLGRARLERSGTGWSLSSDAPLTLHSGGARSSRFEVAAAEWLRWEEERFDVSGASLGGVAWELPRTEESAQVQMLESGLVLIDLRVGHGPELRAGASALVDLDIRRMNGQLFESTRWAHRKFLHLQPAPGNFIEGFRRGVLGMRAPMQAPPVSERHYRRILAPPDFGFGSEGRPPLIRPGEPLVIDIELHTLLDSRR